MPALTASANAPKLQAMVETLLENFRPILLVGVVLVVGLGQISRIAGSALGVLFFCLIAFLGYQTHAQGHEVGVGLWSLPPSVFYGVCCLMAGLNLVVLVIALSRSRAATREAGDDPSEE